MRTLVRLAYHQNRLLLQQNALLIRIQRKAKEVEALSLEVAKPSYSDPLIPTKTEIDFELASLELRALQDKVIALSEEGLNLNVDNCGPDPFK